MTHQLEFLHLCNHLYAIINSSYSLQVNVESSTAETKCSESFAETGKRREKRYIGMISGADMNYEVMIGGTDMLEVMIPDPVEVDSPPPSESTF